VPLLGDLFARYEPQIRRLPRRVTHPDLDGGTFRLHRDGKVEIFYAPMDWLRPSARLAIVGITPAKDTMLIAYQTLVDGIAAGRSVPKVLDDVKTQASFSGFRPLLTSWLTWLDVHEHLGVESAEDLWERGAKFIQPTSAVRYPVFVNTKNYSGRNPDLVKHPILLGYVREAWHPNLQRSRRRLWCRWARRYRTLCGS
jgi:hypothetical protein